MNRLTSWRGHAGIILAGLILSVGACTDNTAVTSFDTQLLDDLTAAEEQAVLLKEFESLNVADTEAHRAGRILTAVLTGDAEVPGPGDDDGSGLMRLSLNPGQQRVCWALGLALVGDPTRAHIHRGAEGVAGGVEVFFFDMVVDPAIPAPAPVNGIWSSCVDVERDLIREIVRSPADFYINVHNPDFPGGAVRGQLSKRRVAGHHASMRRGTVLRASLNGAEEVPNPGDDDGSGAMALSLNRGQSQVCWSLKTALVADPTRAHIHRGAAGVAGGVEVFFFDLVVDPQVERPAPEAGMFRGCVDGDRALMRELLTSPEEFYINVHNPDFAGGAVRGQLERPNDRDDNDDDGDNDADGDNDDDGDNDADGDDDGDGDNESDGDNENEDETDGN